MSKTNIVLLYSFFLYRLHSEILAWRVVDRKMFRSIKINGLLIQDQTNFVLSSSEHSGNTNKTQR